MADTKNKSSSWITVILTVVAILFASLYFNKCNENKITQQKAINLINAMADTIHHYKAKDSGNVARIAILETQTDNAFGQVLSNNEEIKSLQETVKKLNLKPGESVTKGKIDVVYRDTSIPVVIIKYDTVHHYSDTSFNVKKSNQWVDYDITLGKNKSDVKLLFNTDFTVTLYSNKKVPYAEIKTDNPYFSVPVFRTYQVSIPKQKKFGIGFSGGVTYIDKFRPYIGFGINYTPLHF